MQSARSSLGRITGAQANLAAKLNPRIKPRTRFEYIVAVQFHLSCSPILVSKTLLCTLWYRSSTCCVNCKIFSNFSTAYKETYCSATNRKLETSSFQQYYIYIQILLKGKRTINGDRSGLKYKTGKQFVDTKKICDFVTMNSKLRICFHEFRMQW